MRKKCFISRQGPFDPPLLRWNEYEHEKNVYKEQSTRIWSWAWKQFFGSSALLVYNVYE